MDYDAEEPGAASAALRETSQGRGSPRAHVGIDQWFTSFYAITAAFRFGAETKSMQIDWHGLLAAFACKSSDDLEAIAGPLGADVIRLDIAADAHLSMASPSRR